MIRYGNILTKGEFSINFFSEQAPSRVMMISLGTGIAPFLAIMKEVLEYEHEVELSLFHSSRYF